MAAIVLLLVLGLLLGLGIALAAKVFAVEVDARLEQVEELLPGVNCGGCGYAGCGDFARALVVGQASPEKCPSCPAFNIAKIAALLGVTIGERVVKVAVVKCGGHDDAAVRPRYNGVGDCRSANLVAGGPKGCDYGCLGLGSCARVCPFGAIEMANGLAIVHPDICTGCGKCVGVCPRKLIDLVPESVSLHVFCNSPDKGAAKRLVCSVSCIGCRKCVKAAGEGQMLMDGFLARVHYADPPSVEIAGVCPTGCLRQAIDSSAAVAVDKVDTEVAHV